MNQSRGGRNWRFVPGILLTLGGSSAWAGSVTGDYSANHVGISVSSQSSFVGATVTDSSPLNSDSATAGPATVPHPPLQDSVSATSSIAPTSGATKDIATGTIGLSFLSGTIGSPDRFIFSLDGNASAVDATNSASEPAGALVNLNGDVRFFIDSNYGPTPEPPGVTVGLIRLDALRAANPFESYSVSIFQDSSLIATLLPGGSGFDLPAITGHGYEIALNYTLNVPFGVDPPASFIFELRIDDGLFLLPEPSSIIMLLSGFGFVSAITWKRWKFRSI
ncbi:MAG: hypothetical protein ABS79_06810 [Planctomycetes bacterium SCN 63-9]|nr:MAG: hypothetical protein ABS79_06810 [Planctomycetes bacterium SCN 63-9]